MKKLMIVFLMLAVGCAVIDKMEQAADKVIEVAGEVLVEVKDMSDEVAVESADEIAQMVEEKAKRGEDPANDWVGYLAGAAGIVLMVTFRVWRRRRAERKAKGVAGKTPAAQERRREGR